MPVKKKDKKKKVVAQASRPKAKVNVDDLIELSTQHFKKQVLFRAVEAPHRIRYRIPTSSLVMNRLLGGGVAVPRITQFYGPSSVYKSTGIYDVIANAQEMGLRCFLFDTEGAVDPNYLQKWGVDDRALGLGGNEATADEVIEQILFLLKQDNPPDVVALDSLTGLLTQREIDKGDPKGRTEAFIDSQNKLQGWVGKFNSIAFRHLNNTNRGTSAMLFANQMRDNVGDYVKAARNQGKTKPTGGHAPRYFSSDIIYMEHEAAILGDYYNVPIGDTVRKRKKFKGWIISCYVEKSRTTPNDSKELFFRFWPETAKLDHIGEVIDLGRLDGLIEQKGAYFYFEGNKLGQGLLQMRKGLIESRERSYEALNEGEIPEDEPYWLIRNAIEERSEV